MAYFTSTEKAKIAQAIKALCKKYKVKGSLSVRNHMTVVLTIKSGAIDFIGNFNNTAKADPYRSGMVTPATGDLDVSVYHYQSQYTGKAKAFIGEAIRALKGADWYDHSDIQTDYFDTAYYVDLRIGKWDAPYILEKVAA